MSDGPRGMRAVAGLPEFDRRIANDRPAAPQVLEAVRAAILSAAFPPGLRLSEQEIAEAMGLSRQPVREAFIRLAGEGLLEIRPQRGTFVARIAAQDVVDSRFVREAVEADIVRRAAGLADAALDARLAELIAAQEAAFEAGTAEFMRIDEDFHLAIAEAAGKAEVWNFIQALKAQMDRVRHLAAADLPRAVLIAQHKEIAAALAARNAQGAELAMRMHLRQLLSDLPKIVAAYPDYFVDG